MHVQSLNGIRSGHSRILPVCIERIIRTLPKLELYRRMRDSELLIQCPLDITQNTRLIDADLNLGMHGE